MLQVKVLRKASEDWGTPGRWIMPGFERDTLELPWRNNERGRSCIMHGQYHARLWESPHLGSKLHEEITRPDLVPFDLFHKVYRLEDKNGRRDCLVHNANFAGEVELGEVTQLHGCTALGVGYGELVNSLGAKQMAILKSMATLEDLIRFTKGEDLVITYEWEVNPE